MAGFRKMPALITNQSAAQNIALTKQIFPMMTNHGAQLVINHYTLLTNQYIA
jgi:hypothetical protein